MQQIIEAERKKSGIPSDILGSFLYGEKYYKDLKNTLEQGPIIPYNPNMYNQSRLELIKDAYRYLPLIYNNNRHNIPQGIHSDHAGIYSLLVNPHQIPGAAHFGMFIKYIQLMGTEEHKKQYLNKSRACQITGCYAQTQVGHGSDIRGLETTATYDHTTKEWIIDSPTSSSAKYWPGQISFFANHAMVFAQTLIKGKNYGVNPFLVPIKDKEYNWLPGIQGGDIGPKIGFHAKQNGYLYFRSVRVAKGNLFTKYAEVTDQGEYKQLGDPRIGYGTMMYIRELISNVCPKLYAQAILISARYSFFRKQGMGQNKKQINIMEYQTQQQKILPRIAQYYAMTVASTKIREVITNNTQRVLKSDFSLLQETHSNLCFSKCLFSEITQDGIQILRRSMGGHGTSYYSGLPQLLNEYAAHNTHEGQNTVMYLQTARYVLKSYLGNLTKGKPLSDSVSYISRFQELAQTQFAGIQPWTVHQLRDVLVKGLQYVIGLIGSRISAKKQGQTEQDIINSILGVRFQQLAQLHGVHFVVNQYVKALDRETDQRVKPLAVEICKLFAIGQIQRLAQPIIQAGFVCPVKWVLLNQEKEEAMKFIRPHTAVLMDSFGIPDKYLRSEIISGDPYQNFLNRARECQINRTIQQSALDVSKVHQILSAKPRL